jgi:hypothetical protein
MRRSPMTVFAYALKAPESRRQYPRRLKIFLDYLGLEGSLEEQAEQFYLKAVSNHAWTEESLMAFIAYEKEKGQKMGRYPIPLYPTITVQPSSSVK